jgi:hypothetical protein
MTGPGVGHNRGPSLEPGQAWRRHCWTEARRALLPHLPLEVIRLRVRRAEAIGLDYRTYATVRATSSCDIVAFLFSSNALRLMRSGDRLPADRAEKLGALRDCGRAVLAHPPHDPARLAAAIEAAHAIRFDCVAPAPHFAAPWSAVRAGVLAALTPAGLPPRGVLLVGDTGFEREWSAAGRLAGYLPAERYFPAAPG